eukprot:CAMPEP_0204342632 /NCGR_PEP_ID=MMETSP0469-20131031/24285_1 /ASSEMBLY_ACC=CAM_ASM_000384 /TAXON_ID=2969 /ORGANISM="Oxyrrhis marina" /LENGTH=427 /DNA_ID=CAMNT_0051327575 /DNA_START=220 /DNA_END=1500 /DNA_ORIENTATION=-
MPCKQVATGRACSLVVVHKQGLQADIQELREALFRVRDISHPAVNPIVHIQEDVRSFFVCVDRVPQTLWQMLCAKGEMVNEAVIRTVARQMMGAVQCCQAHFVPLRGCTPWSFGVNGTFPDFQVVLYDFGWSQNSRWYDKCQRQYVDNFVDFLSPEAFSGQIAPSSAVWSVAVILYVLLCGHTPFSPRSGGTKLFPEQHWNHVSTGAIDLLKQMMVQNAGKRPTAAALLEHQWFKDSSPGELLPSFVQMQHQERLCSWLVRKAAMYGMARQLNTEKIRELRRIYQTLDSSKSGTITLEEMRFALSHFPGYRTPPLLAHLLGTKQAAPTMQLAGSVNYAEFVEVALAKKAALQEDMCWVAFQKVGDGRERVARAEAIAFVRSNEVVNCFGADVSRQVGDLLETGSGDEVSFQEVIGLMRSLGTVNEFW